MIERAGGREIISRSRSARHKRASKTISSDFSTVNQSKTSDYKPLGYSKTSDFSSVNRSNVSDLPLYLSNSKTSDLSAPQQPTSESLGKTSSESTSESLKQKQRYHLSHRSDSLPGYCESVQDLPANYSNSREEDERYHTREEERYHSKPLEEERYIPREEEEKHQSKREEERFHQKQEERYHPRPSLEGVARGGGPALGQGLVGAQGLPQDIQEVLLTDQTSRPGPGFQQIGFAAEEDIGAPSTAPALRETIFSAEIRSVEYETPPVGGRLHHQPGDQSRKRETVLFDDIGDIDLVPEVGEVPCVQQQDFRGDLGHRLLVDQEPQVTYDLIEGHLPPPGLTVLPGQEQDLITGPGQEQDLITGPDHPDLISGPDHQNLINRPDHQELLIEPDPKEHTQQNLVVGPDRQDLITGPDHHNLISGPDHQKLNIGPDQQVFIQGADNINRTHTVDDLLSQTPDVELQVEEQLDQATRFCSVPESEHVVLSDPTPQTSPALDSRSHLSLLSPSASVSLDNLYLGEEASSSESSTGGSSRVIGALTITQYEGSPRRYGPRKAGVAPVTWGQGDLQGPPGSVGPAEDQLEGGRPTGQSGTSPARPGLVASDTQASGPAGQSVSGGGQDSKTYNGSSGQASVASSKSVSPKTRVGPGVGRRVPGFPQRVNTTLSVSVGEVGPGSQAAVGNCDTTVDTAGQSGGQQSAGESQHQTSRETLELLTFDEGGLVEESGDMTTTGGLARGATYPAGDQGSYDYRYEFSETRKVLEEFFKAENEFPSTTPVSAKSNMEVAGSKQFRGAPGQMQVDCHDLDYSLKRHPGNSYVGQRLADVDDDIVPAVISKHSSQLTSPDNSGYSRDLLDLCGPGVVVPPCQQPNLGTSPLARTKTEHPLTGHIKKGRAGGVPDQAGTDLTSFLTNSAEHFDASRELPPPPPMYDSRNFTLSPETTDCDSADLESELSVPSASGECEGSYHSSGPKMHTSMPILEDGLSSGHASDLEDDLPPVVPAPSVLSQHPTGVGHRSHRRGDRSTRPQARLDSLEPHTMEVTCDQTGPRPHRSPQVQTRPLQTQVINGLSEAGSLHRNGGHVIPNMMPLDSVMTNRLPPPSPAPSDPLPNQTPPMASDSPPHSVAAAIKDIKKAIQSAKTLQQQSSPGPGPAPDPWLPRSAPQPTPDQVDVQQLPLPAPPPSCPDSSPPSPACSTPPPPPPAELQEETESEVEDEERVPTPEVMKKEDEDLDTDQETDRLLGQQYNDDTGYYDQTKNESSKKKPSKNKEGPVTDPKVLIEGVLFRARYLGSTQLVCEGQPTKATRMMQAEEAVSRIKAPEGETQPSTEVDLFISTEKIMVLNTDLKEIMMDHGLRTISYIADIGELVVIMARRRILPQEGEEATVIGTTPKMICHVFESEEAQFIAQSIGQAFQVAYMEFLKANGIEDHSFVKEMDYQEVLNSQEIFGDELAMFAKKELQKEVVVPKAKGEILGVVIVESGWGSMLPTIVIANLCPNGPAARCGHLNIGDQVIAINGVSLVGLPLSTCQQYIKNTKNKTAVKLTAVSCPPVVEVKIKRPDTKYQLGFSVQNGVICSLLRGGIAERGGVRVGHRIIEINGQSVVAVPHERIVNLLATSVGEIAMKTMPTSMYRLLTGQENPVYI